jgi:hypothetical protein
MIRARIFKLLWSPGFDSNESIPSYYVARRVGTITSACICKPFKQTRNRFPTWWAGTTTGPARARICRSFKETRYRFSAWRAGTKPFLSYWTARLHRLAKSIPRNRFLGSINVYKYGLRLHRLGGTIPWYRFLGSLNVYKYGLSFLLCS